jgi:hypothetical protein
MSTDELNGGLKHGVHSPRRIAKEMWLVGGLLAFLTVLVVLSNWQTDFPLSPRYTLRITDNARIPIPGVLVVHEWGLSVMQNGENQAMTDTNGVVRFDPVAVEVSMLRCLLIKVQPAARGLGYENYNSARCRIYLPEGSTVDLTEGGWNPAFGSGSMMYTNVRGAFIRIIDRSHRLLAQAARHSGMGIPPLPPRNSPQGDHTDFFFTTGLNEFELQVRQQELPPKQE